MNTTLPNALRIAAGLLVAMATFEWLVLDTFMPPPYVMAVVLFALSFGAASFPKPVAVLTLVVCVMTPLGAINGYLNGLVALLIPTFDVVLFGWLATIAIPTLRGARAEA